MQRSLALGLISILASLSSGCFAGGSGYNPCPEWVDGTDPNTLHLPEPRTVAIYGSVRILATRGAEPVAAPERLEGSLVWDVGVYSVSGADAQGYPVTNYSTGGVNDVTIENGEGALLLGATSGGADGCQGCGDLMPHLMTCAALEYPPTLSLSDGTKAVLSEARLRRGAPSGIPDLPEILNIDGNWEELRTTLPLQIQATFTIAE